MEDPYVKLGRSLAIQIPCALLLRFLLPTDLRPTGFFMWSGVPTMINTMLDFLDGAQIYFIQMFFFHTDHSLTSILQCKEFLGFDVKLASPDLSPILHPEIMNTFNVRLTMFLALLAPVVAIGFLYNYVYSRIFPWPRAAPRAS